MSELEFENKVNDYLKKIINDESYFSSGDFYNFYDSLTYGIGISNIDELVNTFNDSEKEKYTGFYNSVKYLYLYINSFIEISKSDISELAQQVLSSNEDTNIYINSLMHKNVGLIDNDIFDFVYDEHADIVEKSSFENKFSVFVKSINKQLLKIFDNKDYLLNNIYNDEILDYLDSGDILNNLDINILNLYLQNDRYDIIEFVSDEVFQELSKEQIKKILKNSSSHRILNKAYLDSLSGEKIKYILSLFDIKSVVEIDKNINLIPFFIELDSISENDLDYLIKVGKIFGIENCQSVIKNNLYVKKIIKSGYQEVFKYLSVDQVDDEILNSIYCNKILFDGGDSNNLPNLLKSLNIFAFFSRKISSKHYYLLNMVGYENVTREMILFCMLDGMNKEEEILKLNNVLLHDKVNEYFKRTLDDIKFALECGYKCSRNTIMLNEDEMKLFIDYNQPEIINNKSDISFDLIKYATLKGHKFDINLYDLLHLKGNFNDLLKELVIYNIENNNFDFCDSVLISFANKFSIMKLDYLLDLYKDDLIVQQYLKFSRETLYNIYPENKEEIYKFFNNLGPTKELYDKGLVDEQLFNILKNSIDFLNSYSEDKAVLNYINFIKTTYRWLGLKTIDQIYDYFNEFGPSDKFYDIALIDSQFFDILVENYDLEKHFESDSVITSYINYRDKYYTNFDSIVFNKDDIYKYFDEFGPNKKFYDYFIFKSDKDYNCIFDHDFDNIKNIYGNDILTYIDFIKKYGNIFNFINEDNYLKYFNLNGATNELKQYLKENKMFSKNLLTMLAHNDDVINKLDFEFVSVFESYIIDKYFSGIENAKEKYDYLLNNLGPSILFNLDNENVLKLISLDDDILRKFMDTIKCCSYTDVPKNVLYNNISISLCNYVFKKEFSSIVNIFTNIKSIILRMSDKEIDDSFNEVCDNNLKRSLISDIYSLINTNTCSKEELYNAIKDCKNLNEDSLHSICRKYLEKSEEKYLEENKDIILNKFGIPLSYDRDDSIKKLSTYYKNNIDFNTFNSYHDVILLMKSKNWNDLKNNEFIDSLNMTKSEYNIILSITEEEFNLIVSAIREKRKPDDSVKDKFKLFNRFINLYSSYIYDNGNNDYILHLVDAKRVCNLELKDIDMFQVLKEMDIDIFIDEVINNEKVMHNLRNVMKNKFIGRLPGVIGDEFKDFYNLDLPDGINNIGLFLTKYSQILDRKKSLLRSQGVNIEISNINMSFSEIIETISAVNSATEEVKRLFGTSEYSDFAANPERNSNSYHRKKREDKLVKIADYLYTVSCVTIPSKDFILKNNDKSKSINFIVGNRTNPSNICHGERTGACMRIGGVGEGLFLKCITDKNWFHIRIEDSETHEYISRVSGFRKGNSVFLNQLRDSCNASKYSNEDLQEFITIYANQLIDETKNSKFPIENVFVNTEYAMIGYNNSKVYKFGSSIQDCYNLDDVEDLKLSSRNDIWTDVHTNAYLLATTEDKKNKDGYVSFNGGAEDTCIYDAVRDKIYGLSFDDDNEKHKLVSVNSEVLMEKINRVNAMKEKLLGKDYRYEISDLIFDFSKIIDGYASSDFYVFIDKDYIIYCDYIESINKDGNIIPYNQGMNAKNEMDKYVEILKNRYNLMEVRHAI